MPHRDLPTLFACWERELALLLETGPSHEEFWAYWIEREVAVEALVTPQLREELESRLASLFAIAESNGYPRPPASLRMARAPTEGLSRVPA